MKSDVKTLYSPARLNGQVARMGRAISRDFSGRTLHVVAMLEDAMVFAADLIREISCPVVCHFVRAEAHEVTVGGYLRKEVFFSHEPDVKGRDVLLVDAVLDTGVTMDFLAKRLLDSKPHSLRVAVLIDRPHIRRVAIKADYSAFEVASNYVVGYGLAGQNGQYRNLPYLGTVNSRPRRKAAGRGKVSARKRR